MQSLIAHYNTAAFLRTFAASCYVAGKLVYGEIKSIALELWTIYTSERAKRLYTFLILSVIALAWMGAFAAVWLGNRSREQFDRFVAWRDRFIASHLEQPSECLVGDEIAKAGCAVIAELFAQADAIMAHPVYADAPATPIKRRRKVKGFQSAQEVIA
jgi:hypothetical protein